MRIFVAVPISPDIADQIVSLQDEVAALPVRFMPKEEFHVTVVPPWGVLDWSNVDEVLRVGLRGVQPFVLRFTLVEYGPTAKLPRLIWLVGKPSASFDALHDRLIAGLAQPTGRPATPHVTLARFHEKVGKKLRDHPVTRMVDIDVPVESVVLYSSERQPGIGYTELAGYPFG